MIKQIFEITYGTSVVYFEVWQIVGMFIGFFFILYLIIKLVFDDTLFTSQ